MSVIMTLRVKGNPEALERRAAENPDAIRSIAERAKEQGLIAHRFYGSEDGWIMVVDEWPDPQSFQQFFESERDEIEPMMRRRRRHDRARDHLLAQARDHDEVGWEG